MKIPGPRGLGALEAPAAIARLGFPAYLQTLSRRFGPVSSFRLGFAPAVFVDDAGLIEQILVTQQHRYVRDFGAALASDLLGEGLLTTEDPAHLARRRTMQPAFHRARVASYAATFVAEAERVSQLWDGLAVDVGAEMTRLTLAVVGETLFGADVRGSAAAIAAVLGRVGRRGGASGVLLLVLAPLLAKLRGRRTDGSSVFFARERAQLAAIVAPLIARRRLEGAAGNDLLSLLLAARDERGEGLSDAALLSEAVTLVLAGHETTANALTWTWMLLARHQHVELALTRELETQLGGRAPAFEDVPRLPYAAAVFAEALRLYPPAPLFARRPVEAVQLGEYRIAAGTSIYVSPYVTQRNSRYFDEPETFAPERWLAAPPPKFAYFPFGGGSKRCIGESFAELEGVLVLATIARRFSLRPAGDLFPAIARTALTRPARPVLLRPVPRPATVTSGPGRSDR